MKRLEYMLVAIAVAGGCTCGRSKDQVEAVSRNGAAGMRVGSASYFLELGALHERYGDLATALGELAQALRVAKTADERIQAQLGLARINQAQGDRKLAINHLEALKAELDGMRGAGAGAGAVPLVLVSVPSGEIVPWLGRLYVEAGRLSDAERLYDGALAHMSDSAQGDGIRRLQIELWRKTGSLPQHIAEKEKALDAKDTDEGDLRFLALAYTDGGAAIGLVTPAWAEGGPKGPEVDKIVRAYERLYEIHRDDAQLRQALISLYERQGKVDQAIRLLREPVQPVKALLLDGTPGAEQVSCAMGVVPRPMPAAVATGAEVVRMLARTGRPDQALTETRKLIALGRTKSVGVQGFTVGARLYMEQHRLDDATRALGDGARMWRSATDHRELAAAQADVLQQSGKMSELKALLDRWKGSEDACLRVEASRREPMLARTAQSTTPAPDSGAR